MVTHSSVPAWRIPGTGKPGGLLSMGSQRVGHDWSDLAAAAPEYGWWGKTAWPNSFNFWSVGYTVWLGVAGQKNRAQSVDQGLLQVLQILVYLISLLSILLRYNDFTGIQKAVEDQPSWRSPNSDHDFFGASLAFGSALELRLSPTMELVIAGCHIKSTCCHTSQSDQMFCCCCIEYEKTTLQTDNFFDVWSTCEAPTYWAF